MPDLIKKPCTVSTEDSQSEYAECCTMIRPVFLAIFFIAVSTVLKNAVKLSKICASLQFLCLHFQILSAKRFVVSSWLAWLWLWSINIGHCLKCDHLKDYFIFFEMETTKTAEFGVKNWLWFFLKNDFILRILLD